MPGLIPMVLPRAKILVVDDEPGVLLTVVAILHLEGYDVVQTHHATLDVAGVCGQGSNFTIPLDAQAQSTTAAVSA